MTRFQVITAGVVVGAVLAAGALHAQQPQRPSGPMRGGFGRGGIGPGGQRGFGPGLGLPLGRLDLTDAQRQQIRSIQEQRAPQLRTLAGKVAEAAEAQRRAAVTVPLDEQAIRAAARDVATAQADLSVERARVYNEVFTVLTPEQQDRVRQMRAQAEARMKERRERAAQRQPRRQI